jgi:hypothetical protein
LFFGKRDDEYNASPLTAYEWENNVRTVSSKVNIFYGELLKNISDGEYRLMALTELANKCKDGDLALVVLVELFHVGFVQSSECRVTFHRQVMDMIASIVNTRLGLLSKLINLLDAHYAVVGKLSIGLMKKVNCDAWVPSAYDFKIILEWLSLHDDSGINELAQYIIESLCWGLKEEGDHFHHLNSNSKLHLNSSVYHMAVGTAVVDTLAKLELLQSTTTSKSSITSFFKSVAKDTKEPFALWCWERILLLSFRDDYGVSVKLSF